MNKVWNYCAVSIGQMELSGKNIWLSICRKIVILSFSINMSCEISYTQYNEMLVTIYSLPISDEVSFMSWNLLHHLSRSLLLRVSV